jgi:transposase
MHISKRDTGRLIEYLSPYSPDFNPIEQAFNVIKARLQAQGISFYSDCASYYELYEACSNTITPEMTFGFFRESGYYV